MKRILTYLIAIAFMFCVFSVNVNAEENENTLESEATVTVLASDTEEEPSDLEGEGEQETSKETQAVVEENEEETSGPEHEKTLTENEDGTHTIGLTVKGETEEVINTKKVNVIVTLDTSGSMDFGAGDDSYYVSTTGGYYKSGNEWEFLYYRTGNNRSGYEYHRVGADGYNGTVYYINGNSYSRYTGTRYAVTKTRMQAAQEAVNSLAESLLSNNGGNNPVDTIQISLVTFATHATISEQPTTSYNEFKNVVNGLTSTGGTNWEEALRRISTVNFKDDDETYVIFVSDGNPTYRYSSLGHSSDKQENNLYGSGQETTENINRAYDAAVDDAKAIVDSGAKFYTIGAYGNVDRMESLTTASGAPKSNYYSAINTLGLEEALNAILQDIKSAGIGSATITDGTTSHVATSTGVSHLLTVDKDSFKYYKDDVEWEDAPDAELNEDGEVVWDLGTGLLDNGVTYKVTFDAWASQEALDLIADLKNGTVDYDSLDKEVQKYLIKNGDTYLLATNTVATLRYVDTRELVVTKRGDNTQTVVYVNPQPRAQEVPNMTLEKEWANEIDEIEKSPITIELLRDGDLNASITLNNDNNYNEEVFIAPGRIHVQGNSGKYQVREAGHDYTFRETGSDVHNWELSSEIFHPMLINDEMTMLVKRDSKPEGSEITNYFIINGNYYERSSINKLVATNERRSWIEVTKTVTSTNTSIDNDQTFDFEISVTDPNGDDVEFTVTSNETKVSENDGLVVTGATLDSTTGNYIATSGSSFTVSIKAGWNIRVINLLSDSTYSISEVNIDSKYALDEVKFDGAAIESNGTETGTIESANKTYSYEYVNKVVGTDIVVLIEWEDEDNLYNNRPTNVTLHLTDGTNTIEQPAMAATRGLSWKYVYTNLPLYDEDGNAITYTLTQDTVNGYKAAVVTGDAVNGFTATNELLYIDLTIVKVWEDEDNVEGLRPETLNIELQSNVNGEEDVVTSVELNSNSWSTVVRSLPQYIDGYGVIYTWVEETVDNYELTDTDTVDGVTTLTNSREVEYIDITVEKVWEDEDNVEGLRPESVTVNLVVEEEVITTVELSDENEWTYTFEGLQKYIDGEEVGYEIVEDEIDGYTAEVTGGIEEGFVVTNSREVEYIDITVEKVWDVEVEDMTQLPPVTIILNANGEKYAAVEITYEDDWTYTFERLQKYVDGEEVVYEIVEVEVVGYTSEITGNVEEGFVVTNTVSNQGGTTEDPEIEPPYTGIDNDNNNTLLLIELILAILIALGISKKEINE